jgi:hypothetical protein
VRIGVSAVYRQLMTAVKGACVRAMNYSDCYEKGVV